MRVARYYTPEDVRLEEQATPAVGPGELLVRVEACGVCGSDVMPWYLEKRAPLVLGHEPAGDVVAVGAGVGGFAAGQRVFVHHHVPCFVCHDCRRGHHSLCPTFHATNIHPGGMAELIRVPAPNVERDVLTLPDSVSYDAATLIEPLGCALRGLARAEPQRGDTLAVLGAGTTGLLVLAAARRWSPRRAVALDPVPFRLEAARRLGADLTLAAERPDASEVVRAWNEGRGADVVFVCTGARAAMRQAFELVGKGGTVMIFAPAAPGVEVPVEPHRFFFEELSVKSSYSTTPFETREALAMIAAGEVRAEDFITHRLPLAEAGRALRLVAEPADSLKVLVEPQK
jgi:L-iditol 2-dehydrogenase